MIVGGQGDDDLRGGTGADTFCFDQNSDDDVLHRFATGTDKIDVSDFGFATTGEVLAKFAEDQQRYRPASAFRRRLRSSSSTSTRRFRTYLASGDIIDLNGFLIASHQLLLPCASAKREKEHVCFTRKASTPNLDP